MKSFILLLVALFAMVQANDDGCSVCGEGKQVTKPDEIFSFPGQPVVKCIRLEEGGRNGLVPLDQCSFLPPIIKDICGCKEISDSGCSVCGDGKKISIPDAVFAFPGQPVVQCGPLESAGVTGGIPLSQCVFLPPLVNDICGCIDESAPLPGPTPSPFSAPGQQPLRPPGQSSVFNKDMTTKSGGMPTGAIIGIIIGVVIVGGLLIALVFVSTSKMRKNKPIITAEATPVSGPPNDAFESGEGIDDKEMI
mmetsp:Transcript_12476/g.13882  ORF Transcript_12476/g.13882 Transcript_12476/m.13882 type:complete len:250 (+) Transcript_12476:106-855(+)